MRHLNPRQNWRETTTSEQHRYTVPSSCTPYTLPSGLMIPLKHTSTITLSSNAIVTPACYTALPTSSSDPNTTISRDPFYASSIPMAYSIAATTTLAYVLLLLLFLPNPPHSRPWLQKVATLSVCICLTIAFAETTSVLEDEYSLVGSGIYTFSNEARQVRNEVVSGIVLKIGRVISDLFLWLAQVQTLIRLFPREREKVVIKWAGFCLILLDTLFSIMESFVSPLASTDSFLDAIPALSYLFQISLGLLYAACVLFYSFVKRRYAYFYPRGERYGGWNIFLVALLSWASVVTPIVFFIVDIAQKDLAGWGDYVRWVGAAAASVVVWEWVDRIEGLEREEGKGGVLGREIYEEDEDDRFVSGTMRSASGGDGSDGSTSYQVQMRSVSGNETLTNSAPSDVDGAAGSAGAVLPPPQPGGVGSMEEGRQRSAWPWKRRKGRAATATPDATSTSTRVGMPDIELRGSLGIPSVSSDTASSPGMPPAPFVPPTPLPPPLQSSNLPVTIIPAPPRGRRGSWREIEMERIRQSRRVQPGGGAGIA